MQSTSPKSTIVWNPNVRLIISDVDQTVADLYTDVSTSMVNALETILTQGIVLYFISGQSVCNIHKRVTRHLNTRLRRKVLIGHCSGVEVFGFDDEGMLNPTPFYSHYETGLTEKQKRIWRSIIDQLINEFSLTALPAMPLAEFKRLAGNSVTTIMLEDRRSQITFEMVNSSLPFRQKVHDRAFELFTQANIPITPRMAGEFALDFAVKDVSKTTAVKYIIDHLQDFPQLSLSKDIITDPSLIEVWGDKFSTINGGTDRHISQALDPKVRSITFREENPEELPEGYNIVIWNGNKHLHEGLLEYLAISIATPQFKLKQSHLEI
jgi:hypothetical protein